MNIDKMDRKLLKGQEVIYEDTTFNILFTEKLNREGELEFRVAPKPSWNSPIRVKARHITCFNSNRDEFIGIV